MSCRYDNRPARESSLVCVVAIELIKPVIITNAFMFFHCFHFFIAFQTKKFSLENMHLLQKYPTPHIGLGVVPGERSFFHENERNDQERSHRSEKKENLTFLYMCYNKTTGATSSQSRTNNVA